MRKKSLISLVLLFITSLFLSGCIVPYWWDDWGHGHGGRGGGHHHGGGGHGGGRH